MSLLSEGQEVKNTYKVERFLGEGAFAEVYRVYHRYLGRQAMKVFKDPGIIIRNVEESLQEAILLSRLNHPNIIRVFEANVLDTPRGPCGFFTMEYIAGGTLENYWRSYGTKFVPIEIAVEIIRQATKGLAIAHMQKPPIIHRDIKPSNILIGYDSTGLRVRVSDFGLARRVDSQTLQASARGTLLFKPPEVFKDFQSDSRAGDVWALGVIMYLLLTGSLPFPIDDTFDGKCFEQKPKPPSDFNLKVDKELDRIVLKALAVEVKHRYPSAKELLDDLAKWKSASSLKRPFHPKKKLPSETPKSALGIYLPVNQKPDGECMVTEALKLAMEYGKLSEAADLLEETFNKYPNLREIYEPLVKLWRKGVVM